MSRAGLEKQPQQVAEMFDAVAERYDRTNTILSGAQDRRWRRHTVRALELLPGQKVLDVAAGTGVSTKALAANGAWCVATDFSLGMLSATKDPWLPRVAGDALHLPFADASFDAVTISFGLRNVEDPVAALTEFARVTRPGGRLVVCEFSRPRPAPIRWGYRWYLHNVLPKLAGTGVVQPRGLHLPAGNHRRLAGSALAGQADHPGRVDRRPVAEHDVRRGGAASGGARRELMCRATPGASSSLRFGLSDLSGLPG